MIGIDNWQYARWVEVIGRSERFNPPEGAEYSASTLFIMAVINLKRPWLIWKALQKMEPTGASNNAQLVGKLINIIGRDMMKIPVVDAAEKGYVDTLMAATGNRRYGAEGNAIGSWETN